MLHPVYIAPRSLEELLKTLQAYDADARLIAGGTDLVPQMRLGMQSPRVLVDPIRLPLAEANEVNGHVHLGARFTHSQVLNSPLLQREFPALVSACRQVGGPPVRNRGTLAGNLVNASPAADSALPLLVYDAQLIAAHRGGERTIPLNEFFLGPGQTRLAADEFLREIRIPKTAQRTCAVFLKLGNRNAMAISVASVAVSLAVDEAGNIQHARVALGSVAPTPLRAVQAEAILQGASINDDVFILAAQAAQQAASPISDLRASAEYRQKMVFVLTRRALEQAWAQLSVENQNG
jgi:carbon-monoxide dehydrogenase medium subunit